MFDLGALLAMVAQKPELASQLDSMGIPAPNPANFQPGGNQPLGAMMGLGMGAGAAGNGPPGSLPQVVPTPGQAPMGASDQAPPVPGVESPGTTQAPIGPWDTTVNPAADTSANGPASPGSSPNAKMMADNLQRTVAPTAPQPFTHGGVVGGVKAPDVQKVQSSAPMLGALIQAMMGAAHGTPAAPNLGALIRGGTI